MGVDLDGGERGTICRNWGLETIILILHEKNLFSLNQKWRERGLLAINRYKTKKYMIGKQLKGKGLIWGHSLNRHSLSWWKRTWHEVETERK